jgi:hypothetical protein
MYIAIALNSHSMVIQEVKIQLEFIQMSSKCEGFTSK